MKKTWKRFLTLFLTLCMLVSGFSVTASAAFPSISASSYLRTYPISTANNTPAYSNSACTSRIGTIYASDEIYIYRIGSSYAYCSYPTSSGRKYAYIKLSAITANSSSQTGKAKASINVYRRSDLSKYYGCIYKNDSIWVTAKTGSAVQIIYPAGSTYKMGWISLSQFNSNITVSDTSPASTLRLTGYTSPGTMTQGSGHTVKGTVRSNYKITKVTVGIYNASGAAVSTKTVYPNAYTYNINSIDSYIHFSYAKPGTNYYKVIASDTKKQNVVLQNTAFTVNAKSTQKTITVFKQTDSRWANVAYGKGPDGNTSYLSSSGCGILSLVNAVYYLNGSFIQPAVLARWSVSNGYRINGEGTSHNLYKAYASSYGSTYGFRYVTKVSSVTKAKPYLQKGNVAVISVPGHLMALVDYNSSTGKYLVLDSYPTSSRGTKSYGYRWMTASQFTGKMAVSSAMILAAR